MRVHNRQLEDARSTRRRLVCRRPLTASPVWDGFWRIFTAHGSGAGHETDQKISREGSASLDQCKAPNQKAVEHVERYLRQAAARIVKALSRLLQPAHNPRPVFPERALAHEQAEMIAGRDLAAEMLRRRSDQPLPRQQLFGSH